MMKFTCISCHLEVNMEALTKAIQFYQLALTLRHMGLHDVLYTYFTPVLAHC